MRRTGQDKRLCARCSLIMAQAAHGCLQTSALLRKRGPMVQPADGQLSTIVSTSAFVPRICRNGSDAKPASAGIAAVVGDPVLKRCGERFFAACPTPTTCGSTLIAN